MNFTILAEGSYPALEVELDAGDRIITEAGAMAWMDTHIQIKTAARGGLGASLKRAVLGGASFFQNEYTCPQGAGKLVLSPGQPGEIVKFPIDGRELFLEAGSYLASTPDVAIDTKWQGWKGMLSSGLFVIKVSGSGILFLSAYGDLHQVDVDGEYVVDNGYAVAWESCLAYKVTNTGRSIRSFMANQLVNVYSGKGKLWVQSRSPVSLAGFLNPFRIVEKSNSSSSSD